MTKSDLKAPEPKRVKEWKLPSGVLSAALSEDGEKILCGCLDGVYLVDMETSEISKLYAHDSYVSSVEWLSDRTLVSAGYDGRIIWFDMQEAQEIRSEKAHQFWSWDLAISNDRSILASVTGQYLAGGYRYEPAAESEPSIRVYEAQGGQLLHKLPHVPSVQAVAISPDGKSVAAGNLMGEIRIYDLETGNIQYQWTTKDFTSWGIIKSHSYLGGIFSMRYTPDGDSLLLAGMGPMRDPMAGNGRQLWQRWDLATDEPKLVDQTHEGESGEGLMEALAVDPDASFFVMGGRLRGGDWNAAFFDLDQGHRLATLKTGFRITDTRFYNSGGTLLVAGATGQGKPKKDKSFHAFGRIELYETAPQNS